MDWFLLFLVSDRIVSCKEEDGQEGERRVTRRLVVVVIVVHFCRGRTCGRNV